MADYSAKPRRWSICVRTRENARKRILDRSSHGSWGRADATVAQIPEPRPKTPTKPNPDRGLSPREATELTTGGAYRQRWVHH